MKSRKKLYLLDHCLRPSLFSRGTEGPDNDCVANESNQEEKRNDKCHQIILKITVLVTQIDSFGVLLWSYLPSDVKIQIPFVCR